MSHLSNKRCVVDEAVLRGVRLGLEGPEERLLGPQDLNRGRGLLGQIEQTAGVGDQSCAHQLAHHHSQVRCDCLSNGMKTEIMNIPISVLRIYTMRKLL